MGELKTMGHPHMRQDSIPIDNYIFPPALKEGTTGRNLPENIFFEQFFNAGNNGVPVLSRVGSTHGRCLRDQYLHSHGGCRRDAVRGVQQAGEKGDGFILGEKGGEKGDGFIFRSPIHPIPPVSPLQPFLPPAGPQAYSV
jgi:hypothetical protein